MPIWAWRLGEALLVAVGNEPYSVFQTELRRRFAGTPVFVLMTTNGGVGYLPPRETYGSGRYQEQQSPYAPGCLEQSIEAARARCAARDRQLGSVVGAAAVGPVAVRELGVPRGAPARLRLVELEAEAGPGGGTT